MDDTNNNAPVENQTNEKSVYEELGGEAAIDAVVDSFYIKVLADPLVNGFFKDIDISKQGKKQKNFIAFATGGPNKYEGRDMRKAHAKFHLEDQHFDKIVELLVATLKEFKVSDQLIEKVGAKLLPLRNEVLNK